MFLSRSLLTTSGPYSLYKFHQFSSWILNSHRHQLCITATIFSLNCWSSKVSVMGLRVLYRGSVSQHCRLDPSSASALLRASLKRWNAWSDLQARLRKRSSIVSPPLQLIHFVYARQFWDCLIRLPLWKIWSVMLSVYYENMHLSVCR